MAACHNSVAAQVPYLQSTKDTEGNKLQVLGFSVLEKPPAPQKKPVRSNNPFNDYNVPVPNNPVLRAQFQNRSHIPYSEYCKFYDDFWCQDETYDFPFPL